MPLSSRKVLLLAADDFEDMELLYPLHRLIEEGVAVTVAGLDDHPLRGKKGYGPVSVDTTVDHVFADEFDALVIPGGYAPDKLRRSPAVLGLVRDFDEAGKPIAFICHAGWVPISAKILKGRRATSVVAIREDMINAGTDWVDDATVVDGNLISARTPDDLGPWMKALLQALDRADGGRVIADRQVLVPTLAGRAAHLLDARPPIRPRRMAVQIAADGVQSDEGGRLTAERQLAQLRRTPGDPQRGVDRRLVWSLRQGLEGADVGGRPRRPQQLGAEPRRRGHPQLDRHPLDGHPESAR